MARLSGYSVLFCFLSWIIGAVFVDIFQLKCLKASVYVYMCSFAGVIMIRM